MSDNQRLAPFGYKWVLTYKCRDGKKGMGFTDNHDHLPSMISCLLSDGASHKYKG